MTRARWGVGRALSLVGLVACGALVASCSSTRARTEVVVRVVADPAVAAATTSLHLLVRAGPNRSQDMLATRAERDVPDTGTLAFPYEVALVPADGDAARVFELTVTASRADGSYVGTARVISGYVAEQTLMVTLRLEDSCLGLPACDPGNTCRSATCVDAYVAPESLAPYVTDDDAAVGPPTDTGLDAGRDAGTSPGLDSGLDAGMDAFLPVGDANVDAFADDGSLDAWRPTDGNLDTTMDANGGAPPQLLWPLSGANLATDQPTVRWRSAPGVTVTLEMCADRACGTILHSVATTGMLAAPTSRLPHGPVFWRVRAGALTSYTWEFFVHDSGSIGRAEGLTMDLDGDGHPDLAVGAPGASLVRVYYGTASGIDLSSVGTTLMTGRASFGQRVTAAGDVNGDGYGDLAVTSPQGGVAGVGAVDVFWGGPGGVDTSFRLQYQGGAVGDGYGDSIAYAGDVNGDGFADLAIGCAGDTSHTGFVAIGHGAPDPTFAPASVILDGRDGTGGDFGYAVAGGDLDLDGYDDVVVGAPGAEAVYSFFGAPTSIDPTAAPRSISFSGLVRFGAALAVADFDGNGLPDVVIGAPGDAAHPGAVAWATGDGAGNETPTMGYMSSVNGDSFGASIAFGAFTAGGGTDIAVGADAPASSVGAVHVFQGAGPGTVPAHFVVVDGPAPAGVGAHFGASITTLGDIDGDLDDELVVGAYGAGTGAGWIYVVSGGASPALGVPTVGPASAAFGRSLAELSRIVPQPGG